MELKEPETCVPSSAGGPPLTPHGEGLHIFDSKFRFSTEASEFCT